MLRTYSIEFHLFGLIGKASHPKIQVIGYFFLKIDHIGFVKFGCYYLQYVPASKTFDRA